VLLPGGPGCGFAGVPPALLLSHASLHAWPCSAFGFDEPLAVPVAAATRGVVVRVLRHRAATARALGLAVSVPRGRGSSAICSDPRVKSTNFSDGMPPGVKTEEHPPARAARSF